MRAEAGHKFIANAIWTMGLPPLPPFATEQRPPSATELEALPDAIHSVLEWLDRIATTIILHRSTPEYKEATRKAGSVKGQSGLTATEQGTRAAIRKAKFNMRTAKDLAQEYNHGRLELDTCKPWQRQILNEYWNGSLAKRVKEASSDGSRDTMCRTPSLSWRPQR